MRCTDLADLLPVYGDGLLSGEDEAAVDAHLFHCDSCRGELLEYREMSFQLRNLGRPALPAELAGALGAIRPASDTGAILSGGHAAGTVSDTLRHWLMPFGAGTVCTGVFVFLFVSLMLVRPGSAWSGWPAADVAVTDRGDHAESAQLIELAESDLLRVEIPENAPEVNPAGALVALTRSIVRGKMNDEEVVVVADVFGNGLANLREVVEPPSDAAAARELERAFNTKPEDAPFLPAKMSKGSDAVRVVVKIQRVEVTRR